MKLRSSTHHNKHYYHYIFQMLHFLHNHPPLYLSQLYVHENMRDLMERFFVLPFSGGCVSLSSVAVVDLPIKGSKMEMNSSSTRIQAEEEGIKGISNMKSSLRLFALPKPNISTGFQKLFKSFKGFSQLFVYKEEMEEEDTEMEIGYPTDVKHMTHIGYDGSTTTNVIKGWDNLISPEFLSAIPSVSFSQFEHSMAAQAPSPLAA